MQEKQKTGKNTSSYLSVRKTGTRVNFYAVSNIWNAEKKRQDKKQVYLGALNGGVYRFNSQAIEFGHLFIGTAHELSYLTWREEQMLMGDKLINKGLVKIKRAGITLLLNRIANEIPLTSTLKAVFGEENTQKILSLAYFSLSFPQNPLSLITAWSVDRTLPWNEPITTETIHQLFNELDGISINRFLEKWLQTSPRENRLPFTISPKASFSKDCSDVMHGTQRDNQRLPEIRLLVIVDQQSFLPLWFGQLPWTDSEADTLMETLNMIERLDGTPPRMVFDRSFASTETFDWMCEHGVRFTMDLPLWRFPDVKAMITEAKNSEEFTLPESALEPFQGFEWLPTQAVTRHQMHKHRRFFTHLYYTHYYKAQADELLKESIYRVKHAVENGRELSSEDQNLAALTIKETEIAGLGKNYVLNVAGVKHLMDDEAGFYAIASTQFKDPFEALVACELRYAIENFFNNIKNEEDCHRLSVYTSHNLQARLFIQFVSQILRSRLRWLMNRRKGKFTWGQTATGVLWDVDSLRQVNTSDGQVLYKQPSDLQREIFEFFKVPIDLDD